MVSNIGVEDPPSNLTSVRDKASGRILTDPQEVLKAVHLHFQNLADSKTGPKTGKYLLQDAPRRYPWTEGTSKGVHAFNMRTSVGDQAFGTIRIDDLIRDRTRFLRCLRTRKKGKAHGPDGIPNELLQYLPEELLAVIHDILVLQYYTRHTPDSLKAYPTILLYKKGDLTETGNWRPIGLATTLYKLWTAMLTEALSSYAEHYDILSSSQEGFRKGHNTTRQLQTFMNVCSDAHLSQQDLYVFFVDFSAAFNTIDHDKLLQIMYDLGFPEDAVNVVQDLHTSATTYVDLPQGKTAHIDICRGTIQGDTLSPFLFSIFMEPLVRWLHAGVGGYKYGCIKDLDTPHASSLSVSSSGAYADDLAMYTGSPSEMALHAGKVEVYAAWGGLEINLKKCGVSAALHRAAHMAGNRSVCDHALVQQAKKRCATIEIDGAPVPFLHPDDDPYPYLGLLCTPTLNWRHHFNKVMLKAKDRAEKINRSMASPRQKLRYIATSIRPYITYSFPLGIFTQQDIALLDAVVTKAAKRSMRLPVGTPSSMVLEEKQLGGMGVGSLAVDYAQLITANLVRALNDPGPLGNLTKAMLAFQHTHLGGLDTTRLPSATRTCHLMTQISIIAQAGIFLTAPSTSMLRVTLEGNALVQSLVGIFHDPQQLGQALPVPPTVYLPLLELHIHDLHTLIRKTKHKSRDVYTVLSTDDLRKTFGSRATARHQVALNRLTAFLNKEHLEWAETHGENPSELSRRRAMSSEDRIVRHPIMLDNLRALPNILTSVVVGDKRQRAYMDTLKKLDEGMVIMDRGAINQRGIAELDAHPSATPHIETSPLSQDPPQPPRLMGRDGSGPSAAALKRRRTKASLEETQARYIRDSAPGTWEELYKRYLQSQLDMPRDHRPQSTAPAARHSHNTRSQARPSGSHISTTQGTTPPGTELQPPPPPMCLHEFIRHKICDVHNDQQVVFPLYNEQDRPAAMKAFRWARAPDTAQAPGVIEQVLTQWHPTYVLNKHVRLCRSAGYIPVSIETCTELPDGHREMLQTLHEHLTDDELVNQLVRCTWADTWEPTANMEVEDEFIRVMLQQCRAKTMAEQKQPEPGIWEKMREREALAGRDNVPQHSQGDWAPPSAKVTSPLIHNPELNTLITIEPTNTVNPDKDIHPTGEHEIYMPATLNPADGASHHPAQNKAARIYDPHGKVAGHISVPRLRTLHEAFLFSSTANPTQHQEHGNPTFATAVTRLLNRYDPARKGKTAGGGKQQNINARNQAVMPGTLAASLYKTLNIRVERFASPLNFNAEADIYFSSFAEDSLFGAVHDTYSVKFQGCNSHCMPGDDPAEMERAVRWALLSLQGHQIPTVTSFLLPYKKTIGDTSYAKWLLHPDAHPMLELTELTEPLQAPMNPQHRCARARTVVRSSPQIPPTAHRKHHWATPTRWLRGSACSPADLPQQHS